MPGEPTQRSERPRRTRWVLMKAVLRGAGTGLWELQERGDCAAGVVQGGLVAGWGQQASREGQASTEHRSSFQIPHC